MKFIRFFSFQEQDLPFVTLAIIVPQPVPFFDLFLAHINNLNYPKDHLHLFIYTNAPLHDDLIEAYVKEHEKKYASAKYVLSSDELDERAGRQLALWVSLAYIVHDIVK